MRSTQRSTVRIRTYNKKYTDHDRKKVHKYSVRVEFGSPGPNVSGILGPAGLKYTTISGSGY